MLVFDQLRYRRQDGRVFLFAFDLLELDGQDLRREPLETRKATLASLLRSCGPGLRLVEHLAHDGDVVYRHACWLGCEGIVSKRLGSPYVSGRTRHWLKFKNPAAPAVKREAEEEWGEKTLEMTTRTHCSFRIDTWTPDGESIVEHVAGVEDYQVALATFRASCERWPDVPITLRQSARVVMKNWTE
jgi:ATP-dependent DNA ligase